MITRRGAQPEGQQATLGKAKVRPGALPEEPYITSSGPLDLETNWGESSSFASARVLVTV